MIRIYIILLFICLYYIYLYYYMYYWNWNFIFGTFCNVLCTIWTLATAISDVFCCIFDTFLFFLGGFYVLFLFIYACFCVFFVSCFSWLWRPRPTYLGKSFYFRTIFYFGFGFNNISGFIPISLFYLGHLGHFIKIYKIRM